QLSRAQWRSDRLQRLFVDTENYLAAETSETTAAKQTSATRVAAAAALKRASTDDGASANRAIANDRASANRTFSNAASNAVKNTARVRRGGHAATANQSRNFLISLNLFFGDVHF